MSIITYTNFIGGKYHLPQAGNTEGRAVITGAIERYEPALLKKALGYSLWKAFTTGMEGSGIDPLWEDLRDGTEYTYMDNTYEWQGIKDAIAAYVYYYYLRDNAMQNTLTGTTVAENENAKNVSPAQKMCFAWNDMVDRLNEMKQYLNVHEDLYTDWKGSNSEVYFKINPFGI